MEKGIEENESQKSDLMNLILEQSSQIKKMEIEMEKLLKEKEEATRVALIPLEVVPILSIPLVVPTTVGASSGRD